MEASLRYQDDVDFYKLIGIANEVDALNAPIDTPSHVREDGQLPKYVAKEVIDIIRKFRNLIHPAAALRQSFDPRSFRKQDLEKLKDMYESVTHSLMY